jgi:hypothetical protein
MRKYCAVPEMSIKKSRLAGDEIRKLFPLLQQPAVVRQRLKAVFLLSMNARLGD